MTILAIYVELSAAAAEAMPVLMALVLVGRLVLLVPSRHSTSLRIVPATLRPPVAVTGTPPPAPPAAAAAAAAAAAVANLQGPTEVRIQQVNQRSGGAHSATTSTLALLPAAQLWGAQGLMCCISNPLLLQQLRLHLLLQRTLRPSPKSH